MPLFSKRTAGPPGRARSISQACLGPAVNVAGSECAHAVLELNKAIDRADEVLMLQALGLPKMSWLDTCLRQPSFPIPVAFAFPDFPDTISNAVCIRHGIRSSLGPRGFGSKSGDLVNRTAKKWNRESTPFVFLHPGGEAIRGWQKG